MDKLKEDPKLLGIIGVVVLVVIGIVVMMGKKKKAAEQPPGPFGFSKGSSGNTTPVKAKLVWFDASEGPFDQAFDYMARKEIRNSKLRYHMQTLVELWSKKRCGGAIIKHPNGRETQVIRFKGGQKVGGKPFLGIDFVSFTSDRRRTMLFLDGAKMEEVQCDDVKIYEAGKKAILAQAEGGRKTCPLSNLAFRQTFVAPVAKDD